MVTHQVLEVELYFTSICTWCWNSQPTFAWKYQSFSDGQNNYFHFHCFTFFTDFITTFSFVSPKLLCSYQHWHCLKISISKILQTQWIINHHSFLTQLVLDEQGKILSSVYTIQFVIFNRIQHATSSTQWLHHHCLVLVLYIMHACCLNAQVLTASSHLHWHAVALR